MDTMETIYARRAVRQYEDIPVSRETIEKLLDAAVQAPSAMNSQPWAFGIIQDAELAKSYSDRVKEGLLKILHLYPMMEKYREMLSDPEYNVFYNAPALIIIYSKPDRSPDPKTDCALAAENLMLAARSMGLGSCWIGFSYGFFNSHEVKQELGVPEGYDAMAPIIVGYPSGEILVPEKEAPEIVFWK